MSTLRTDTLQNAAGSLSVPVATVVQGSAKAWVNFNGVSNAIRASFNVSSITDGGTGIYTVNFTTALVDANYCVSATASRNSGDTVAVTLNPTDGTFATTSIQLLSRANATVVERDNYSVAIFR